MDLVELQNNLDNSSFLVLFVTMLMYWVGAAFPAIPYLSALSQNISLIFYRLFNADSNASSIMGFSARSLSSAEIFS